MEESAHISSKDQIRSYTRIRRILSVSEMILTPAIVMAMILTGFTLKLEKLATGITQSDYLAFLIFCFSMITILFVAGLPISFSKNYIVEHRYGLSNQTITSYITEGLKSALVGAALGIPVLLAFYYILRNFPEYWWLIFGTFIFFFSIVLGRFVPVFILPLFYKLKPVDDSALRSGMDEISGKAGLEVNGVYTIDMSKNTRKVNAAFTGLGKSKRILLGDTLMNAFSNDEIMTVYAHEAGHYFHRHVLKLTLLSIALTFGGLYIVSKIYPALMNVFGFESNSGLAALPLLALLLGAYSLLTSPLTNIVSRKFEVEADTFALETTKNKEAFISAMNKLAGHNLAERSPNKIIEFLFHSHPSIEKRVDFAERFAV